ncbi:MAG: FAD-binding protein [Lentisphaeria bacterium]|nr:FAD-binding protein [Lentisphaeria bacterium]
MNASDRKRLNTLIIGSGAAGLAAAVRLKAQGVENIAIYTEGLKMGTSINTGSDKQTYYKLGMYGSEPDAPELMAQDLAAGGSVHGDIALIEAALSPLAFHHLVSLGVPFPHDMFGQHIGYKTDHDPKRRATSCGPYTSRDMCLALTAAVREKNIPVFENRVAVKLLTDSARSRVTGAIFINTQNGDFEVVQSENIIFAAGGPGGLYETSVYPKVHTGGIGLAIAAGAECCNLAESQYGLASIKFRWNVSGSYMQVLPRFVSTDEAGQDEREFLREYFDTPQAMYDAVFLKGYQWPFAAGHVPGSSLIDIFTYIETVERGRRVYLDYRSDPADLDFNKLSPETREYLERSNAIADTPLKRLQILNQPAIDLYARYGIKLETDMLEIAVCAQHNNGGLAGNIWWESTSLKHLFPIGEVNGSHGVTRPGGSALNAGQVGAFRAAEYIAARCQQDTVDETQFDTAASAALNELAEMSAKPADTNWQEERQTFQHRMSEAGAFIREKTTVAKALEDAAVQFDRLRQQGIGGLSLRDRVESLRNIPLCLAHTLYLEAVQHQISTIGSRGGSLVLSPDGEIISAKLNGKWKRMPENREFRKKMVYCSIRDGKTVFSTEDCRPIPETDGWFENIWHDCRNGKIYD